MKKGSSGDNVLGISSEDATDQNTDTHTSTEDQESETDVLGESIDESDDSVRPVAPQVSANDDGIPWVYTRDNVKQDRDMVQFYLRAFVQEAEDDFVDAVADELGTSVSKTDVREAAYVAAMHDPEIVADELKRWGFESDR